MELKEYAQKARVTCKELGNRDLDDTHMMYGMMGELGELADALKKPLAYGKLFDIVNVKEELGDMMWYWINFCTNYELDPDEILELNINKLKARYGEKFTNDKAINRDLEKERKILEDLGFDEDTYDYVADDFNFDVARERSWK